MRLRYGISCMTLSDWKTSGNLVHTNYNSKTTVVCGLKLVYSGNTGGKPKLIIFLDKAQLQYRRQNEVV